jgi:hypothetical protein
MHAPAADAPTRVENRFDGPRSRALLCSTAIAPGRETRNGGSGAGLPVPLMTLYDGHRSKRGASWTAYRLARTTDSGRAEVRIQTDPPRQQRVRDDGDEAPEAPRESSHEHQ